MKKNKFLLKKGTVISYSFWTDTYQDYWFVSNIYIDISNIEQYVLTLINGKPESPTSTSINRINLESDLITKGVKIITTVFVKHGR